MRADLSLLLEAGHVILKRALSSHASRMRGREATAAVKVLAAAADPMAALSAFEPPSPRPWLAASRACLSWPDFAKLMRRLVADRVGWPDELGAIIAWYRPILERKGDDHRDRLADLDQLRELRD